MFLLISTKLRSLDPTLLYCIDSDWTPLSIGGNNWCPRNEKFGVLGGKVTVHVGVDSWPKPHLKSMTAHIYETKVFRPYICIDSDWTPLSIGGKKLVSLGTTKFGVLGGKVTVYA